MSIVSKQTPSEQLAALSGRLASLRQELTRVLDCIEDLRMEVERCEGEDAFVGRLVSDFGLSRRASRESVLRRFRSAWPDLYRDNPRAWRAGVLDELHYERLESRRATRKRTGRATRARSPVRAV